ncbi:MAG: putative ABC transporter permease [Coriobacteriales bacterium]|jgi:hypothetical protein|nr:putative ABC transporter permease [Coriobacteriales bacterium]
MTDLPSPKTRPPKARRSKKRDYPLDHTGIPLPLKVLGGLCILAGSSVVILTALDLSSSLEQIRLWLRPERSKTSVVIYAAMLVCRAVLVVAPLLLGIRLLMNRRRHAARLVNSLIGTVVATALCDMMLFGLNRDDLLYLVILAVLVVLSGYIDPSLAEERLLQRRLRTMEARSRSERGGRDGHGAAGTGPVALNFFNLFWIFVACSVIGLLLETVFWFWQYGCYQNRAGLLFGPFSPIYGFGGILMTLGLSRLHDRPVVLVFLASALIGGAFEYVVSWFLQFSFGITAWDYTGTWLSIDGRTNGEFMAIWGVLGVAWLKFLLPSTLRLVNAMPWKIRYSATTVSTLLMLVNGTMTLMAFDCWFERASGYPLHTPIEQFFGNSFDDGFMADRFQSMSMDPADTTRIG